MGGPEPFLPHLALGKRLFSGWKGTGLGKFLDRRDPSEAECTLKVGRQLCHTRVWESDERVFKSWFCGESFASQVISPNCSLLLCKMQTVEPGLTGWK